MKLLKIAFVFGLYTCTTIIIVPMCQMQYKSQKWEVDNATHYRAHNCSLWFVLSRYHLSVPQLPHIDWQIIIENFHCVYHRRPVAHNTSNTYSGNIVTSIRAITRNKRLYKWHRNLITNTENDLTSV